MNFLTRFIARRHGERPAPDLDGYRRAGAAVFDLVAAVDQTLVDDQLAGRTPWTTPAAAQVTRLCAWNAFVLQAIGDGYLDAHDRHGPTGWATEQVHEQVLAYYRPIEGWVERGRLAATASPGLPAGLPAPLPGPAGAWRQPFPADHVAALRQALATASTRGEAAARGLLGAADAGDHTATANSLSQVLASAGAAATFAEQSAAAQLDDAALTVAGRQLHEALDQWYRLGQMAAAPSLLPAAASSSRPG